MFDRLKFKMLFKRLRFAARSRCPCGAGLAYDPSKYPGESSWDCSDILLGLAIPSGKPGSVTHTGKLPFSFYEVKSECQPSANGETTRPAIEEVLKRFDSKCSNAS